MLMSNMLKDNGNIINIIRITDIMRILTLSIFLYLKLLIMNIEIIAIKTIENESIFAPECNDCSEPKDRKGFVQIIYASCFH